MRDSVDSYLALAEDLANAASQIIRRHFRTPVSVDDKADASPVTVADRDAEAAMRTMIESGIRLGAGSGAFQSANYSPMLSLWWLVTGKTVAGSTLRSRTQNLTRAEALRLYTMGSAWLTFEEGRKGSIEVGKYADLAVLNADYLTVPEEQIRSLQSLLTIVGGRVVYAAGPFDPSAPKGGKRVR